MSGELQQHKYNGDSSIRTRLCATRNFSAGNEIRSKEAREGKNYFINKIWIGNRLQSPYRKNEGGENVLELSGQKTKTQQPRRRVLPMNNIYSTYEIIFVCFFFRKRPTGLPLVETRLNPLYYYFILVSARRVKGGFDNKKKIPPPSKTVCGYGGYLTETLLIVSTFINHRFWGVIIFFLSHTDSQALCAFGLAQLRPEKRPELS